MPQVDTKSQQQSQPQQKQVRNPFQGYSQQPDALQKFLGETPKVALILMAVAGVGASGFLGNVIGSQAPSVSFLSQSPIKERAYSCQ